MGDSENVQQPENPGLDDDDDVSAERESGGTFEKPSDEVLASTTAPASAATPLPVSKLTPATSTTLLASAAVGTNAPLPESKLTPATSTTLLASAAVGTNAPLPVSELTPAEPVVEDNQMPFDTEEGFQVDSKQVDARGSAAQEIEKSRDDQTLDPSWEIDMDRLIIGELIASGAAWNLHKGTYLRKEWHTERLTVAIKSLKPDHINTQTLKQLCEQAIRMSKLKHPNVVEFVGACIEHSNACIVTEFFERKSIGTPSYQMIWLPKFLIKAARECAEGMEFLHGKEIIHGNLKANNIHNGSVVKVSDFWCSKVKTQSQVLHEDKPSDVFSFGSVISNLMTTKLLAEVRRRETYPEKLIALIQSCRSCKRDERPSFAQVVISLKELEQELEEPRKEEERRKEEEERWARHGNPYCFGEKVLVMPTAEHRMSVIWLHDDEGSGSKSSDFVRSLGLPHVKWVCPTAPLMVSYDPHGPNYTQWFHGDGVVGSELPRLKESEEYVAKLLKDEPEDVLKVVAGIGNGSRLALYIGVRWALGVHPFELGAVLAYNGLPPVKSHLLQKIGTVDGSTDRAKTLPVRVGYKLNPSPYKESFFEAVKIVDSFVYAGFARATLLDLSSEIEELAEDVVSYLTKELGKDP